METKKKNIDLWGGIECTINRVGDQYFNQLEFNGHANRIEDIDMFAELGIKTIRYPILWEQTAPGSLDDACWKWADERLNRLQELGICPIVGFVHHGSGPTHTSLTDPEFPDKLAAYATVFAQRYPWVKYFTPVNEPLTTARFSGLYGHWYPHGQDNETFAKTLIIQCKGIVSAMKAIRLLIPDAKLVQTEDCCKTSSTPLLAYQADYENVRRWLSFDLLCGMIDDKHPMLETLLSWGVSRDMLRWFQDNQCAPDIIGFNHYLTSNRFLDENTELYPSQYHGGNDLHRYADVEAINVKYSGTISPYALLKEIWERYQLPIAITEVHLCASREEQLRWFKEFWEAAVQLNKEGIDIRAVTAWSLLGSFSWNCLVTHNNGFYESGVFDLRGPRPRPTALAHMLKRLAADQTYDHPVLAVPGSWKTAHMSTDNIPTDLSSYQSPVLILGATGMLGKSFAKHCQIRRIPYRILSRKELDITLPNAITQIISQYKPWAIINAAGYEKIDQAENDSAHCFKVNSYGPSLLAEACRQENIQLLTFSSSHVFDGKSNTPYLESGRINPLNVYGHSKAESEKNVLQIFPDALVVRTSSLFSHLDAHNFLTKALQIISEGKSFLSVNDIWMSPTYVPDIVDACLDLLLDQEKGIRHLTNTGIINKSELIRSVATMTGMDTSLIKDCTSDAVSKIAAWPRFSALSSEKGIVMPSLDNALERYCKDYEPLIQVNPKNIIYP